MTFSDDLDRQRAQVMRRVRQASTAWADAMKVHKLAPPDPGFADRLRGLAGAAASEQIAWEHAHAAGLLWRPVPGAERAEPPYELRPGTGRRGPEELWAAVRRRCRDAEPRDHRLRCRGVADAFGEISEAAGALADAVTREDEATQSARSRARGAA